MCLLVITNKERENNKLYVGCRFSELYDAKILMTDTSTPNALLPVSFGVMWYSECHVVYLKAFLTPQQRLC